MKDGPGQRCYLDQTIVHRPVAFYHDQRFTQFHLSICPFQRLRDLECYQPSLEIHGNFHDPPPSSQQLQFSDNVVSASASQTSRCNMLLSPFTTANSPNVTPTYVRNDDIDGKSIIITKIRETWCRLKELKPGVLGPALPRAVVIAEVDELTRM